jgi:hypothetical protein
MLQKSNDERRLKGSTRLRGMSHTDAAWQAPQATPS